MQGKNTIIAITGGIGAGKSVVSAILLNMGYSVYDCDSRAKELMNTSALIKDRLTMRFGNDIYLSDSSLDKEKLGSIIFNSHEDLNFVNGVVHPVVKDDMLKWNEAQCQHPAFVETALLKESGMERIVDEVWVVKAPLETRVQRVMKRNAITREKVIERINSQIGDFESDELPVRTILNDGRSALLPQVAKLLSVWQK